MDACYGTRLLGPSWADDEDDDFFDINTFKAKAAALDEHNNPSVPAEHTALPTIEEVEELEKLEESLRLDDDDDLLDPEESGSFGDMPSTYTFTETYRQLPYDHALYLQVPFPREWEIPNGLHPFQIDWLTHGKNGANAYPELLREVCSYKYTLRWNYVKQERGIEKGEIMHYKPSPLRNEVTFDEDDDEEQGPSLADELSNSELEGLGHWSSEPASTPPGSPEVVQVVENAQKRSRIPVPAKANLLANGNYRQEGEASPGAVQGAEHARKPSRLPVRTKVDIFDNGDLREEEEVLSPVPRPLVNLPPVIKFTCEDELVDQDGDTEMIDAEMTFSPTQDTYLRSSKSSIYDDHGFFKGDKRDSVHEDQEEHVAALFPDDGDRSDSTSPQSSAVDSTDEEIEVVKKKLLVLSLGEISQDPEHDMAEDKLDSPSSTLSSNTTISSDEGDDIVTKIVPCALVADDASSSRDDSIAGETTYGTEISLTTSYLTTDPPKDDEWNKSADNNSSDIIITESHDAQFTPCSPTPLPAQEIAMAGEELCRRLKTAYFNIYLASKMPQRWTGLGTLRAVQLAYGFYRLGSIS